MTLNELEIMPPWDWPEDTGEFLRKTLTDSRNSKEDRMLAADLASAVTAMDDRLAGAMLTVIANGAEPADLRAATAISFGPVLEQCDLDGFDEDEFADPPVSEAVFERIKAEFHEVFHDEEQPKELRRRILEASIRAPEGWHKDAIRAAYASTDEEWKLTAVFAMRWAPGDYEKQILESLNSKNPEIRQEAVLAAGAKEVDAAWPHISRLLNSKQTDKDLLLAAIEAAGTIRPSESIDKLVEFARSDDEDIAEAASEALSMARGTLAAEMDDDFEEDDEPDSDKPGGWVH